MTHFDGIIVRKWIDSGPRRKTVICIPCLSVDGASKAVAALLADGFYSGYSITVELGTFDYDEERIEDSIYRPENDHA